MGAPDRWVTGRRFANREQSEGGPPAVRERPRIRWSVFVGGVVELLVAVAVYLERRTVIGQLSGWSLSTTAIPESDSTTVVPTLTALFAVSAGAAGSMLLASRLFGPWSLRSKRAGPHWRRGVPERRGPLRGGVLRLGAVATVALLLAVGIWFAYAPREPSTSTQALRLDATAAPEITGCGNASLGVPGLWTGAFTPGTIVRVSWVSLDGVALVQAVFTDPDGSSPSDWQGGSYPAGVSGSGAFEAVGGTYSFGADWNAPNCTATTPLSLTIQTYVPGLA